MKKNKWLIMFAAMIMFAVGCQIGDNQVAVNNNDSGSTTTSTTSTTSSTSTTSTTTTTVSPYAVIDYTSYEDPNRSISVKNNTTRNLVAFKGEVNLNNLISGIPASAGNHGLKKTDSFTVSSDFALILITEDVYQANLEYFVSNNTTELTKLSKSPFAQVYCFYNKEAKNNNGVFEISKNAGGDAKLTINNGTKYNIELRIDGMEGEILGYVMKNQLQVTFPMAPGDYNIFPLLRIFDPSINEIRSFYPRYEQGDLAGEAKRINFSLEVDDPQTRYATDWISNTKIVPNAAYIKIVNNADNAVSLYKGEGATAMKTSMGRRYLNSGASMVYEVVMEKEGPSKYADYVSSAQFRIGDDSVKGVYLTSGTKVVGDSFNYYAGKMYTVTVSGVDHTYSINTSWMDTSTDVEL